jgi:putative ABC transport system substrate-binding protein
MALYSRTFAQLILISLLLIVIQATPTEAADQPIVILSSGNIEPYQVAVQGARSALLANRVVTYVLDDDPDRIAQIMRRISASAPRAIIAVGSQAVLAIKAYPVSVPVIMAMVINHLDALTIPNSWAVSMHLPPKNAYDAISQVFPGKRVAIAYNPDRTGGLVGELLSYFKGKAVELVPIIIRHPYEIAPAIKQQRGNLDALWLIPDSSFIDALSVQALMEYSVKEHLPIIGYSEAFAKSGAVLAAAGHYEEMGRQAGELAGRIIRGETPSRVEPPRRISTFINIRVARLMNIRIGDSLLALADQVYPTDPTFLVP